ncbi:MAG: urease accessory protein UreF, partial [Caulobacteraceae bacterium]
PTVTAWLHAFASNLTSIALRAVPLGQTDGVAVLSALEPLILDTAARADASSLDDLGACALMSDIASMRHETQHVRLFIS